MRGRGAPRRAPRWTQDAIRRAPIAGHQRVSARRWRNAHQRRRHLRASMRCSPRSCAPWYQESVSSCGEQMSSFPRRNPRRKLTVVMSHVRHRGPLASQKGQRKYRIRLWANSATRSSAFLGTDQTSAARVAGRMAPLQRTGQFETATGGNSHSCRANETAPTEAASRTFRNRSALKDSAHAWRCARRPTDAQRINCRHTASKQGRTARTSHLTPGKACCGCRLAALRADFPST